MYTKVFVALMIILGGLGILMGCILYFGFDPTYHPTLSIILMGIAWILAFGSIIGLLEIVLRKIASRGFLYPIAAFRSFRHGLLIALLCVVLSIFYRYNLLSLSTGFLVFFIIFLLEIILTKIEDA